MNSYSNMRELACFRRRTLVESNSFRALSKKPGTKRWNFHGNSTESKPWNFHGISMEIPRKVPQRQNRGIAMEIPQNQNRGISRGRSGHLCG